MAACASRSPRPPSPAPAIQAALPLVPAPSSIETCSGALHIDARTTVSGPQAEQLARWLGLPRQAVVAANGQIELRPPAAETTPEVAPPPRDEQAFHLEIRPEKATIRAHGSTGLFYGAQTLAQLAGARRVGIDAAMPAQGWNAPCVTIDDAPRTAFRAMHLDVARHFFARPIVERYIDLLAFYRFDVFHWHLTDDQGFRFTSASHPELASAAAYSIEDMRAVVAYAKARHVTVVPEIEMPGHSRAVLDKHPELSCTGEHLPTPTTTGVFEDVMCAGNPATLDLVRDVLADVVAVFPSELVHVGGDEVPPTRWNACPKCQARMKALHTDAPGLEHAFMSDVFALLALHHRRPAVWDEALPETPGANAPIVFAWQSRERGDLAVSRGFETVYTPYEELYFNFKQRGMGKQDPGHEGQKTWPPVHQFSTPASPHVVGAEGTLWTEFVTRPEHIDRMVMPRMAALAEALWSFVRPSDEDFARRFDAQMPLLDASDVAYYVDPPVGLRARQVFIDETTATLAPPLLFRGGTIRYSRDGSAPTAASPRYRDPLQITESMTLSAALVLANGRTSPVVQSQFVKETPRPPVTADRKGVDCTYYEGVYRHLDEIGKQPATSRFTQPAIALTNVRPERFALSCSGFIEVANTGVYRVDLHADDALRVTIDGTTVAEIDGEKGPRSTDGDIALAAGPHRIDALYFQGTQGMELTIELTGPDGVRRPPTYVR